MLPLWFISGLPRAALRGLLPLCVAAPLFYGVVVGSAQADRDHNGIRDDVQRVVEGESSGRDRAAALAFARALQSLTARAARVPCDPSDPLYREVRAKLLSARARVRRVASHDPGFAADLAEIERLVMNLGSDPTLSSVASKLGEGTCGKLRAAQQPGRGVAVR